MHPLVNLKMAPAIPLATLAKNAARIGNCIPAIAAQAKLAQFLVTVGDEFGDSHSALRMATTFPARMD